MTQQTVVAPGSSFTVPAGITRVRATARGAAAVPNFYPVAGRGAIVRSLLSVSPADVLAVSAIPGGAGGTGNGTGGGNGGNGGDGVNIAGLVFAGGAGGNAGTMASRAGGNPHGDAVGGDAGMAAGAAGSVLQTGSSEYPAVDPGSGAVGGTGGAAGASPNPGTAGKSHADGGNGGAGGNGSLGTVDPPGSFSNYKGAPGGGGGGGGYGGGGGAAGSKYSGGFSAGGGGGSSMADEWVGFNTSTTADALFETAATPLVPTPISPTGNAPVDRTAAILLQLAHNGASADVLDAQTDAQVRHRKVGSGSWTTVSSLDTGTSTSIAANTYSDGDQVEWQAMTYADGIAGPWSDSALFTAKTPPTDPVVTAPSAHSTVETASVTLTWSHAGQVMYRARVVGDKAGDPDTATVYADSGAVTSAATTVTLNVSINHLGAHVQLQVRDTTTGLWSHWVDVPVTFEWAGPPKPKVTLATDEKRGCITVTVTSPDPVDPEPTADRIDIYLIELGVRRFEVSLAPGEAWTYWVPVGDVGIEAVAVYTPTNVQTSSGVTW